MQKNKLIAIFLVAGVVAGVHSDAGVKKFDNYDGELKDYNHERHPINLCRNALNVKYAKWVGFPVAENICSKPIKCSTLKGNREIILEEKPEDGVVCFSLWFGVEWDYKACINGECVELRPKYLQLQSADISSELSADIRKK